MYIVKQGYFMFMFELTIVSHWVCVHWFSLSCLRSFFWASAANSKTTVVLSSQVWTRAKVREEVLRKKTAAKVPSEPAGQGQLGPGVSVF